MSHKIVTLAGPLLFADGKPRGAWHTAKQVTLDGWNSISLVQDAIKQGHIYCPGVYAITSAGETALVEVAPALTALGPHR